jgi:hypothetical protein
VPETPRGGTSCLRSGGRERGSVGAVEDAHAGRPRIGSLIVERQYESGQPGHVDDERVISRRSGTRISCRGVPARARQRLPTRRATILGAGTGDTCDRATARLHQCPAAAVHGQFDGVLEGRSSRVVLEVVVENRHLRPRRRLQAEREKDQDTGEERQHGLGDTARHFHDSSKRNDGVMDAVTHGGTVIIEEMVTRR